jgi:hypothetical protein
VVRTKKEKERDLLLKDLTILRDDKVKKQQLKRAQKLAAYEKEKEKVEARKRDKMKTTRKEDFVREARMGGGKKKQKRTEDE